MLSVFNQYQLALSKAVSKGNFSISDDVRVICLEANMSAICDTNKESAFFLQNYSNNTCNRQYLSDVSALWSKHTTLTSIDCYWWYVSTEYIKSRQIETKNYFLCFQ